MWDLQKKVREDLMNGSGPEYLILCSHPPVITIGRSGSVQNILTPQSELNVKGIEIIEVERGGDVTYHSPEQLIAYPILNLSNRKKDVDWYMRSLEEVIIRVLSNFDIIGKRVKGRTGVWIQKGTFEQKIASMGIRISRWFTLHGLSINVRNCSEGFSAINPCGLIGAQVTSIEEQLKRTIEPSDILNTFCLAFLDVFEAQGLARSTSKTVKDCA